MKILLTSNTNNITNGIGNFTHELCSFLKDKVEIQLLLPRSEKKYDYVDYPTEYVLPDLIFNVKTPKFLQYLTFRYKTDADIVHSISEFPHAIIAAGIASRCKKKFVMGTQGTYAIRPLLMWPEKYFLRYCYNTANAIIAPSRFTRENIIRFSKTKTPIELIHNGVNFQRFQVYPDLSSIRSQYPGKKILLTVGGLKARKGQDVVIRALGILKNRRPDLHYICVGSGKHMTSFRELAAREGVENSVSFFGEVGSDDLIKYFRLCDVYIHTPISADWNFEGFGIVYLEASACGKPIIAADSGGIRDAVIEGKTGLIVPENDPAATANAIGKLLDSPELRAQLGNNGWEYAKEHDWPVIGAKIINLYKKI